MASKFLTYSRVACSSFVVSSLGFNDLTSETFWETDTYSKRSWTLLHQGAVIFLNCFLNFAPEVFPDPAYPDGARWQTWIQEDGRGWDLSVDVCMCVKPNVPHLLLTHASPSPSRWRPGLFRWFLKHSGEIVPTGCVWCCNGVFKSPDHQCDVPLCW